MANTTGQIMHLGHSLEGGAEHGVWVGGKAVLQRLLVARLVKQGIIEAVVHLREAHGSMLT